MTYQPTYAFTLLPNLPTYIPEDIRACRVQPEPSDPKVCVAPDPATYTLPLISGNFPKSLIIERDKGVPMFSVVFPPALYTAVRSSTSYERMAMFAIGQSIAREMNTLFYCTQLQRVDPVVKGTITSPAVGWENYLAEIRTFVGSNCEANFVPTADEMYDMFPIEMITMTAISAIGSRVCAESLFVPMKVQKDSEELAFPTSPEARGPTVMVPVVYVEPLKVAMHPRVEPTAGPFESQLFVIAGDVLVVPYSSDIMTISCAHNAALKCASQRGVHHIRAVISWDLYTGQVSQQLYEVPL